MRSAKKVIMLFAVVAMLMSSLGCSKVDAKDVTSIPANTVDTCEENQTYEENESKAVVEPYVKGVVSSECEWNFVTEVIVNSANNKCSLLYDPDVDLDMDEAHLLAKTADYEGGTSQEKELIMKILATRKQSDFFPDDIKSILRQRGMFYLRAEAWNSMESPSEESVSMAREILDSGEICEYTHYNYQWSSIKEMIATRYPESDILETDNYIFWK